MNRKIILLVLVSQSLWAQQDELRMSIYFGGGSYYIDEEQISGLTHWLDSIPSLLEKYQIQLTSHTDPVGGKEFNEMLSRFRSQAVLKILLENSIPENLIHVKDWDYENAVYDNDSYRGRALNRRVDIVLHPIVF
jgi:outer membrane protein OmpA-like peptidoglycan-associated protein